MALKKCLKIQRRKLKRSSVTANHIFLIKVSKPYFDGLDSNLTISAPRRMGKTLLATRLKKCAEMGHLLKNRVHYRHGLKMFSTEGL